MYIVGLLVRTEHFFQENCYVVKSLCKLHTCVVFHLPLSQHFFLTSDAMISNFSINHIKCQITSVLSSVSCSLVSVRKSYACTQMDPFWSEYRGLLIDISGIENLHLSPSPNTQCSKIRIYQVFLIQ